MSVSVVGSIVAFALFCEALLELEKWWMNRKWFRRQLEILSNDGYSAVFTQKSWIIFYSSKRGRYLLFNKKYDDGVLFVKEDGVPSQDRIDNPEYMKKIPHKIKVMWGMLSL